MRKKNTTTTAALPTEALSKITTLDELELFVIHHVLSRARKWPTKRFTPPDDSLMTGQEERELSYEEAAEYFRKNDPGLSEFLRRAHTVRERFPEVRKMRQLERACREVKRERGAKEAWIDKAYKEHPLANAKRKQIRDNRKNAPKGGRAPKCYDATIIDAFEEYAHRHKDAGHSMPILKDALRHITTKRADNPHEYINLSFVQLDRRIRKIAKNANKTPPEWFAALWERTKVVQ